MDQNTYEKLRQSQMNQCSQTAKNYHSAGSGLIGSDVRPTPSTQYTEAAAAHLKMSDQAAQAARFLRENPAFDEFVELLRLGVITLY